LVYKTKFMFYLVLHMDPVYFYSFIALDQSILFIHYLQMISFGDLLIQRLFCFVLFCVDVHVCVVFFGSTCIEL
jgi:hypothetical protein